MNRRIEPDRAPRGRSALMSAGRPSTSLHTLAASVLMLIAGCTRPEVRPNGGAQTTPDDTIHRGTPQVASLSPADTSTATALYLMLNETPVPRGPIVNGDPRRPFLDWNLDVDRAPCAGETFTLRSTIAIEPGAEWLSEFGMDVVEGELWITYWGEEMSIVTARPGPTRVEGHGRTGQKYKAVWQGVTLTPGEVDERVLTFKAHAETYDHRLIDARFIHSPRESTAPAIYFYAATLYLQIGGPTQYPQAVENMWDIGPEDQPSRCATPTAEPRGFESARLRAG